jgi:hypothetical protein
VFSTSNSLLGGRKSGHKPPKSEKKLEKKKRGKKRRMNYDATQRIKLWQQGRGNRAQVSVPSTMTSTDMRTCPSAPQHHTNSQTPSTRTSSTPASPALLKHKQRIEHARLKKQKKSEVPHVTGKNWSGKTTIARAPQLSCFRKKNSYSYSSNAAVPTMKHEKSSTTKKSYTTTAWNNSSNTSHSSNASKKRMQRGSFSSPRPTKTLVDGPKNDRHNGAAIEYVPQNDGNTGSGVFANELMALRNQLQAEERRHILLQAEKANAHVLGKAIPQASDAPQAPTQSFSCIAPPAPPMCPPPTLGGKRSNQQSPEPFSNVLHRPVGTAEISRVPVPCVPFANNAAGSKQYEVNNDNENTNDENNTWTTNDGAHKSIPQKKPNWTSIQQTIHSMIDKDVKKRKQMEHRLRSLEENNLKILGVNINQFKEICGKGPVILSPAPSHTPTKRSARAAKSNQKHVQRMGKAMDQKLNRSSPRSGTSSKRSILCRNHLVSTTMSKEGGSLSRSSRGLSL